MSINLLAKVQENLHYPPLQKIDPNTQLLKNDNTDEGHNNFSQAAIPAVLSGLYEYSITDQGAAEILRGDYSTNWVTKIFDDNKSEVIKKIASYANMSNEASFEQLNNIADEAIKIASENMPVGATAKDIKIFFSNQLNNILPYLPAMLRMGDILNDTTLDDNTNKMEGPITSLMHSIGSAFSTPETEEDKHQ